MNDVGKHFMSLSKTLVLLKFLTIEASGIAPAIMASFHFDVPCLFAKKLNLVL